MQSDSVINRAISNYADMVYRILICHIGNKADSDDAFQDVFVRLYRSNEEFISDEHLKAYLIRISINIANDYHRRHFWKNKIELEDIYGTQEIDNDDYGVMEAILSLPNKYRSVIYMFYYEEYKADEIAAILHMKTNTVYSLLKRGREKLKELLKGESDESIQEDA